MKRMMPATASVLLRLVLLSLAAPGIEAREIRVPSAGIATIQQGVDVAGPGDTVLVAPGTYTDGPAIESLNPVVSIWAEKAGLRLKAAGAPGSVRVVGPGHGTGIAIYADDVRVEGFDISGFSVGIAAGGPRTGRGRIFNNSLRDCASAAITLTGSTGYEIDHNHIKGGEYGIFLNGWPGAGPNTNHHLHHNVAEFARFIGIFLWNSPSCEIDHNRTVGNGQSGIYLASSPGFSAAHNDADDNGEIGVAVGNSPGGELTHNRARHNGIWGISIGGSCGTLLAHNTAEGNGEFDLFAPDWDSPATCNTYAENRADTAIPSLLLWRAD